MAVEYLLHESSVGYAVFKVLMQGDTIGQRLKEYQKKSQDLATFGKMIQLVSFAPFQGAAHALENANDISEGIANNYLITVLESNLPQTGKKNKVTLGVSDKGLASSIQQALPNVSCETSETTEVVADLLRGIRLYSEKLLKQLQEGDVSRAQLGLGHAYSRAKVKFSVQKNDNHIIQAIATLDHLDKAVNQFSMRCREWYSWHFPELVKIVPDNLTYAKLVLFIRDKQNLSDDSLHDLATYVNDDSATAQAIIDAAKASMGREISEQDLEHVTTFAKRTVKLAECRKKLQIYLADKMGQVAPNLAALIGDTIGARLISKAGSLTNLSKYAASTVQILGAEKALFRALKTKGNTPKYGLIYHSSFIGRAATKNKGRISRFLANKCSIASRIDNFSEVPNTKFGEALKKQVEERLDFYNTGAAPTKNEVAMKNAMDSLLADMDIDDPTADAPEDVVDAPGVTGAAVEQKIRKEKKKEKKEKKEKKDKSEKKEKKRKHEDAEAGAEVNGEKKKKKKKSKAE